MDLYADYIFEKHGRDIIVLDDGFITYEIADQECYIVDIYVRPEKRRSDLGTRLGEMVQDIAKKSGCKYLTGTVNLKAKDPDASVMALYSFGFKLLEANQSYLTFIKQLGV